MPEAWPFLKPVNKKQVKDYYSVIKKPIDMETMGKRIQGKLTQINSVKISLSHTKFV